MSRIAVISDIHANLHALSAVLAAPEVQGVDRFWCSGDIVGYGPRPNECVGVLRDLPLVAVAGNHDLVALGRAGTTRCDPLARRTLEWTVDRLTEASRGFLATLPQVVSDDQLTMAHGSLTDPFEYVSSAALAVRQLVELSVRRPQSRLLLLGHTHLPMAYGAREGLLDARPGRLVLAPEQQYVLNPGSVGQSRDDSPDASCLVLDLETGDADFVRVAYDIDACREDLERQGLPAEACHRRPVSTSLARRVGRRVRRLLDTPTA